MKKLLSVLMFLSACMPLMLGLTCVAAYPKALEMMKLADSPDMAQPVSLFGICLLCLAALQFLAGAWVWQNNWAGVVLSRWSGLLILFSGSLICLVIHRPDLGIPDLIKGLLITVVAFLVKKDR